MHERRPQRLLHALLTATLLATAACGDDIRGSLNDLVDRAEEEMLDALEIYRLETIDWYEELEALPGCTSRYGRVVMPRRAAFDDEEEYYLASENCHRRQLIRDIADPLGTMVRQARPADYRQGMQADRSAIETMTEAELVNLGPRVRALYTPLTIEAAEAAQEQRREGFEADIESFSERLRAANESGG